MYENYWNLKEKPFRNTTDRKYFFYGDVYEESYLRFLYSVNESQGLLVLFGESGCGKSLLCKIFMQDMLDQGYKVAFIDNPASSPREFLQQTLFEFGMGFEEKSKIELWRTLRNFVESSSTEKCCILLIDEAHLIRDPNIFEEIRLFMNIERDNKFLLHPILVGRSELLETISKTSLRTRVALQARLAPLDLKSTGEYIYYRVRKSGGMRDIFKEDAIREIYNATQGIPREINNICDLALLIGCGEEAIIVDQALAIKAVTEYKSIGLSHGLFRV